MGTAVLYVEVSVRKLRTKLPNLRSCSFSVLNSFSSKYVSEFTTEFPSLEYFSFLGVPDKSALFAYAVSNLSSLVYLQLNTALTEYLCFIVQRTKLVEYLSLYGNIPVSSRVVREIGRMPVLHTLTLEIPRSLYEMYDRLFQSLAIRNLIYTKLPEMELADDHVTTRQGEVT